MTFLLIEGERYALPFGDTVLGGDTDETLRASPIASLAPFALVEFGPDVARIRALDAAMPATLRGQPLTVMPVELQHGDVLIVGGHSIYIGDLHVAGRTSDVDGVRDDQIAARASLPGAAPTADTGGRLVARSDGRVYDIPASGLVIGRDPDCGIVLSDRSVSRRHASVSPGLLGYTLSDASTNGVFVNDERIGKTCLLGQGDVIRIGELTFDFTADPASYEPDANVLSATPIPLHVSSPVPELGRAPQAETHRLPAVARPKHASRSAPVLLATLEVIAGSIPAGTRFRIERPVIQIGRGAQSDVRLLDDSVSTTHASLVQRNGTWQVLDHGSKNGTYVDDRRVTECLLSGPSQLRFGTVTLLFRPLQTAPAGTIGTLGVFGITDAEVGGGSKR